MKVNNQSNIIIFNIIYFIYRLGSSIINVRKFWEKLLLAARAIVAVENPADVCAISCQPQGIKKNNF
jgi:small subunit ribosomal protein SAe